MAANMMMDLLRKIQRDLTEQKDYMRRLHVIHQNINEKFNLMTEKFAQRQVTMERLERQDKKNMQDTLLFGNDQADIFKDKDNASCMHANEDFEHNDGLKEPQKYIENEAHQLQTLDKEALMEWNAVDDNKKIYQSKKSDDEDVREFIIIAKEMREIKDLIADFVKTGKTLFEKTRSPVHNQEGQISQTYFNTEQISQLNDDLKQMMSETREMKELFKEMLATRQTPVDHIDETTPTEKNNIQTIQISPAYFSTDQISKLNNELKRITETYQASNFPNIEVVPDTSQSDHHLVMQALRAGVFYEAKNNTLAQYKERYGIKLGMSGFKRLDIRDLLTDYPDLTLYEVVKEGLKSTNEWSELSKVYDFTCPHSEPKKMRSLETVQISPTYFDKDQITKLNSKLKEITEKYLATNIFPNIEVVPNTSNFENHPVMKALNQGIEIHKKTGYLSNYIHIGSLGFERSEVEETLKSDPHITLYKLIIKHLKLVGMADCVKYRYYIPQVEVKWQHQILY